MGAWGEAAWDNDAAADWYGDLFDRTKLAKRVEKTLKKKDVEEWADEIRAAAYLLVTLGRVYIWPIDDLERHLAAAVAKLEKIQALEDYADNPLLAAEIAALRERLASLQGTP